MKKLAIKLQNLKKKFFNGPSLFNYPGRSVEGYRSVNLTVVEWIRAFVFLHFTLPGRVLFLLTLYVLLVSSLTLLMPLYFLSLALVSLFLTNIIIGWLQRPRLEVKRIMPELVPANTLVRINYEIHNQGKKPILDLSVDTVPLASKAKLVHDLPFIQSLECSKSVSANNQIVFEQRGRYLLPRPVVASSFPFGLWSWSSQGNGNKPIKVYPRYVPLKTLNLPGDAFGHYSDSELAEVRVGQSMDFHGCREFKYGDNPRNIHALSWARLGTPVIKEFNDEGGHRIAMIIEIF